MRLRSWLPILLAITACADDPNATSPDATQAVELAATATPTAATSQPAKFAPGQVIVKLRRDYDGAAPIELGGRRLAPVKRLPSGSWLMQLDDAAAARVKDPTAIAVDTLDAVRAVAADATVEYATENRAFEFSLTPNDPEAGINGRQGWSYYQIGMYDAWNHTTGSSAIRIGFIDSGRRDHPELAGRWAPGRNFIGTNSSDATDYGTWAHGIHVAGIAGATANNNAGGAGICWNCQLVPMRVTPLMSEVEEALAWAAGDASNGNQPRVDVVNMSLNDRTMTDCNDVAFTGLRSQLAIANSRGIVVVASAGNLVLPGGPYPPTPTSLPRVPSTCPGVISVVASDPLDTVPQYSARGIGATLAAPGGGMDLDMHYGDLIGCSDSNYGSGTQGVFSSWSTSLTSHCYRHLSGTSMSAPHVAGTVALMRSLRSLSPAQVEAVLRLTAARPQEYLGWGFKCEEPNGCGAGRLDANAAVAAVHLGNPVIAQMTPPQRDFGTVTGASAPTSFVLRNLGFATLNVTAANPMTIEGSSWFTFAYGSGTCTTGQTCNRAFSVAVNGTSSIPVRCTPTGTGTQTAELIVPSNSVGQTRVQLWCSSAGAAVMQLGVTSLAFGDIPVGSYADLVVPVTNTGTLPLTVTAATATGGAFSRILGLPTNLAPGATSSVTVRCAPAAAVYAGTLTVNSNGGDAAVALSCRGVAPILVVTPASLGFGDVLVATAATGTVTISNTGTAPLSVYSIATSGAPFSRGSIPTTIQPGTAAGVIVTCVPSATGLFSGTLAISTDAGAFNVALTCRGVTPVLFVSSPSLEFGDVVVGSSSTTTLGIGNSGTGPLTVTALSISAGPFTIAGTAPQTLNPGTTWLPTLTCAPTAAGTFAGTLVITTTAGTASVSLSCRGTAPNLVATASVTFPAVLVGSTSQVVLQLSNIGNAPSTITSSTMTNSVFSASSLPATIAPGASILVTLTCAPTAPGDHLGGWNVGHDNLRRPLAVALACTAANGRLVVDVPADGSLELVPFIPQQVTVHNDGVGPLTIIDFGFTEPGFAVSGVTLPAVLAVGQSLSYTITCEQGKSLGVLHAKHYAKHDGLDHDSLFAVSCGYSE